jgi:hypothetical protein
MADNNQDARNQADADHRHGTSAPNTNNWDHGARTAYETEWTWLKQQEGNKK